MSATGTTFGEKNVKHAQDGGVNVVIFLHPSSPHTAL